MTARPGTQINSFAAGEIEDTLYDRADIKQFYAGAASMRNVETVAQGGFRLTPRSRLRGRQRGLLAAAAGVTVPTLGPHAGTAVLAVLTLGAASAIEVVEVTGVAATQALASALQVEALVSGVWTAIGGLLSVGTTARTRRVATVPGAALTATAIRLRLAVVPPSATTFTLGALAGFTISAASTVMRTRSFAYSRSEAFTAVFGVGVVDFWNGATFLGTASLPYTADQMPDVKVTQRLDTMLLFHPDVAPHRILRDGSNHEWDSAPAPFTDIPLVDYGGSYIKVDDVWKVTLRWDASSTGTGTVLEISVNGEDATGVEVPETAPASGIPDWPATETALIAAIEALPQVAAGITVTSAAAAYSRVFTITFSGADNSGQRFSLAARVTNVITAGATAAHTTFGDAGGEAIMSVTRGWPRCGVFYQDRLIIGGFRSKGSAWLASQTAEYFSLNIEVQAAAGALLVNIDTSGAETIVDMVVSRHLVILTDEAEYFVADRVLSRTQPVNVVQSSRNGVAENVAVVESEGALLYVGRTKNIIYGAQYSEVEQAYVSDPLSLMAPHLCAGVISAARQKPSQSTDAVRYWLVRDDGAMTLGTMLRGQEVTAFSPWLTDGRVLDACVNGDNTVAIGVARLVDGVWINFYETLDPDLEVDQAVTLTLGAPATTLTGLADFEGASVWASVDGYFEGPHVVDGGAITLDYEAQASVTLGRWTPPVCQTLPHPRMIGDRMRLDRPVRVHSVRANVLGSTSLAISANGRPVEDVPFLRAGDVSDQPVPPTTRQLRKRFLGYNSGDAAGRVTFTQIRPGKLFVRSATIEARS